MKSKRSTKATPTMDIVKQTFHNLHPQIVSLNDGPQKGRIDCWINGEEYHVFIPKLWFLNQGYVFIMEPTKLSIGASIQFPDTPPGETKYEPDACNDPALIVIARRWLDWDLVNHREGPLPNFAMIASRPAIDNIMELVTSPTWAAPVWAKEALGRDILR